MVHHSCVQLFDASAHLAELSCHVGVTVEHSLHSLVTFGQEVCSTMLDVIKTVDVTSIVATTQTTDVIVQAHASISSLQTAMPSVLEVGVTGVGVALRFLIKLHDAWRTKKSLGDFVSQALYLLEAHAFVAAASLIADWMAKVALLEAVKGMGMLAGAIASACIGGAAGCYIGYEIGHAIVHVVEAITGSHKDNSSWWKIWVPRIGIVIGLVVGIGVSIAFPPVGIALGAAAVSISVAKGVCWLLDI